MNGGAPHLFCFGYGFSAQALAKRVRPAGWRVSGTARDEATCRSMREDGVQAFLFDQGRPLEESASVLADVTHLLSSVPPGPVAGRTGDPVLDVHASAIIAAPHLRWIGDLSTTGVYGDTGGAVVDETAPVQPGVARSVRRAAAERAWLELFDQHRLPVHVFRLAGIYGPGRSTLDAVRRGEARRVIRPGHLFSRIHVDDIAAVLEASIAQPNPGAVYNVCDDEPAAPADVVDYVCGLLGVVPPPPVLFEQAEAGMSPMARSFWQDNRRVDNGKIKRELGVRLAYPTYREGLAAILGAEGA